MSTITIPQPESIPCSSVVDAVAREVRLGLTSVPKTLSPWLFYDQAGSELFEQITDLPEYYLTRTERGILAAHAQEILTLAARRADGIAPVLTLIELGAGTATKTGLLLREAVRQQGSVVYQPVDVSESALAAAAENISSHIPGVAVRPQVADYTREPLPLDRLPNTRTLALYIGSSIGNFATPDALDLLRNLRAQLLPGDALLLGTDLAPGPHKDIAMLIAAYDDLEGTTAAFNLNVLARINRDLGADFNLESFQHIARWNAAQSRMEMHLESRMEQCVHLPANSAGPALHLKFSAGERIHTENSYKFTHEAIAALFKATGFSVVKSWHDLDHLFAVTLATADPD